jgi:histidyl-tRNA synthetase
MVEQTVLDQLRETFELHGFAPVETRAAEPLDSLLRKGEIDKEVYVLRRLHADPNEADSGLGLHFDLTVPFARYVLEHAGRLEFPFRRYQIQKVWRGERPQEGRYREFTQADIDIVARGELAFHHDVEIARVMSEALRGLSFLPALQLQINNRKVLEGFCRGLGVEDVPAVLRALDRLDKVPGEVVRAILADDVGLTDDQAGACLSLAEIGSSDSSFVTQVRALGISDPLLDEGLGELAAVIDGCASLQSDRLSVRAELRIARGLDYYTGTVFETRMAGFERLGSICSGGRYDSLATDGKVTYPGVGISLGVTRMLMPLFQRGLVTASRPVPSAVLIALPGEDDRPVCEEIAQLLRRRGIACEVAASAQKYGKQIRAAERRGIPFVWFPGAGGASEVKDIRSGEQVAADPKTWSPPAEDLRPQVLTVYADEEDIQ